MKHPPPADRASPDTRSLPSVPQTIAAARLFNGQTEVFIEHDGQTWRLRITRNGKLILTK
jgi:hemin uptake protein HemP